MASHQQQSGTNAADTIERSTRTTQTTEITSTQATSMNKGLKVAYWVTAISGTGIITVMAGFLGNQTSKQTHHFLFKGSMWSMIVSFVFGVGLFIFSTIYSENSVLKVVLKILVVTTVASIAVAVGFGAAFYFEKA